MEGRRPWNVGRERSFEEYRATVFADDRLALRAFLWQHIALRSLVTQRPALDPATDRVVVFTSSELPPLHRAALATTLADAPWAMVAEVDPDADGPPVEAEIRRFLHASPGDGPADWAEPAPGGPIRYVNVRLDDDDALGRDHLERLRRRSATVDPDTMAVASSECLYTLRLARERARVQSELRFGRAPG